MGPGLATPLSRVHLSLGTRLTRGAPLVRTCTWCPTRPRATTGQDGGLLTRVQYTTNHQALAVICGESCSCSSCLSTSEIVGPRSRELANLGTRPRGRGRGSRYREAEARQRPRTQTSLTGTLPHGPRDYYDTRYAIRYGPRECDMRSLWAARIRYGPRD